MKSLFQDILKTGNDEIKKKTSRIFGLAYYKVISKIYFCILLLIFLNYKVIRTLFKEYNSN